MENAALDPAPAGRSDKPGAYAWLVFALVFSLMLSEYMSRQVVTAVFPFLKQAWSLSDTQLGSLVGVVALVVGVLTLPLSLLVDRYGRALGVTLMALAWGAATIAGGMADGFLVLLCARMLLGVATAAFGSAGGAILLGVFPPRLHSTVMGAFLAAGLFGSVLGVALGGVIAERFGWRAAFFVMGVAALVLAAVFRMAVRDPGDSSPQRGPASALPRMPVGEVMRELFSARTAVYAYLGAGLQMFSVGTMLGWIPSYLNRYYGMDASEAGLKAGMLVLVSAFGMTLGGAVVDRLSRDVPARRLGITAAYAGATALLFAGTFLLDAGVLQLTLMALGLFFSGAHNGPCSAIVTEVNDPRLHATVLAVYALSLSLLGMAAGPFVIGLVADRADLHTAMLLMPAASVAACLCLLLARRHYEGDARRFGAVPESSLEALEEEVTGLDFHAEEHAADGPRG